MSKGFKNIAVFSLWLAGLVIVAHLFIAHDHHSDSTISDKEGICHSNKTEQPTKSSGFPLHCHALNDITFNKVSTIIFVHNDIPTCDLFITCFFDSVISATTLSGIKIKDFQKPIIVTDFLRLSPFRAPPSLV